MKNLCFLLLCLVLSGTLQAQKMITRSGELKFEASMPAFEEVAATNTTASCIFDKASGDFVVLALVKAFRFKVPLMEEHFNENYIESSSFPKATFKGKVLNFDASKGAMTKGTYDVEGDLTLHGVTKKIKAKITFTPANGKLVANSSFNLKPQDFGIKIPNVVKSKVSDNVKVYLNFALEDK
ncbi:YceI family protein [Flavobacterium sp. UBA7682]|uniref:YceI family protein n=1 Tax=Flavobacterium sp. UBA7682 TaxID=1946560 RepID=UPI0025BCDEF2|nr:YceI family protein [Flavobacterium sp. UBA7682]